MKLDEIKTLFHKLPLEEETRHLVTLWFSVLGEIEGLHKVAGERKHINAYISQRLERQPIAVFPVALFYDMKLKLEKEGEPLMYDDLIAAIDDGVTSPIGLMEIIDIMRKTKDAAVDGRKFFRDTSKDISFQGIWEKAIEINIILSGLMLDALTPLVGMNYPQEKKDVFAASMMDDFSRCLFSHEWSEAAAELFTLLENIDEMGDAFEAVAEFAEHLANVIAENLSKDSRLIFGEDEINMLTHRYLNDPRYLN